MDKKLRIFFLFFFIFDISFIFFPISTGKISILVFLFLYYSGYKIRKMRIHKRDISFFMIYFLIVIYNVVLFIFNYDSELITVSRLIYFFINSFFMGKLLPCFFDSIQDFFETLGIVVTIQSVFILFSWYSSSYREYIDTLIINTGNISFLSDKRPPGLMSSAGAGASIILALGASGIFYLIINGEKNKNIKLVICFFITTLGTFIVGRTGLIILLIMIISIIVQSFFNRSTFKKVLKILPFIMFFMSVGIFIVYSRMTEQFNQKIEWILSDFSTGYTVKVLKEMGVAPISMETIIGTSKIRYGVGLNDSGYIQNYQSMGLIMTFIFYLLILCYVSYLILFNCKSRFIKNNYIYLMALIVSMFVIEMKEPFIFYYFYPMFIFVVLSKELNHTHVDRSLV